MRGGCLLDPNSAGSATALSDSTKDDAAPFHSCLSQQASLCSASQAVRKAPTASSSTASPSYLATFSLSYCSCTSVISSLRESRKQLHSSCRGLLAIVNTAISFGARVTHVIICSVIPVPVGLFAPSLYPPTDPANHQVLLPAFSPDEEDRHAAASVT